MTDLRTKAAKCDVQTHESDMIRDKSVFGVHCTRIKQRLSREADLTLARALDVCRAAETIKHQIDTQMHAVYTKKNVSHRRKTFHRPTSHQTGSNDKESRLVTIADIHTLQDSVRHMARFVRNVRAETTSQSCVGVVDLEAWGEVCACIAMIQADFFSRYGVRW